MFFWDLWVSFTVLPPTSTARNSRPPDVGTVVHVSESLENGTKWMKVILRTEEEYQ